MSELFRRTDCVVHLVPGIDAVTGDEACLRCGARRQWVVPTEPEHQHQWLPWLALPNGSSWTQCTGCGEEVQFDHQ